MSRDQQPIGFSRSTGGSSGAPATDGAQTQDPDQTTSGKIPPVDNVDGNGPYTPAIDESAGPSGGSWVFYPEELGRDGFLHPVFNWGPGAGTGPREYTDHLSRIASHGIVVISQPSSGTGVTELAALDWILDQNDQPDSIFYQKLDPSKVGAGGHSKGSFTTYAMGDDPRLVTTIQVCGGRSGAGANLRAPVLILGASGDMATPGFTGDYQAINAPVVFLTFQGSDHIMCARDNLVPWVSWLRWHLGGEEFRRDEFVETATSPYCKPPWECQVKNW
ncbi:MAG: hypothetical protein JXA30_00055 [Deltaproteobacteria bacterium]|nr:hypothetical protein [Deltaproteobacteria bacterium]